MGAYLGVRDLQGVFCLCEIIRRNSVFLLVPAIKSNSILTEGVLYSNILSELYNSLDGNVVVGEDVIEDGCSCSGVCDVDCISTVCIKDIGIQYDATLL